jgi:Spy/CpxP family protein refolding chaperone
MKWKVWLGLVALFLSGVLVGVAGTGVYFKGSLERALTGGHRPMMGKMIMHRLNAELHLTEQQRVEVGKIVCDSERQLTEMRRKHRPEVEEVIQGAMARIKPLLSPEQQQKLDAIHEKAKERRKHQMEGLDAHHGGWDCN